MSRLRDYYYLTKPGIIRGNLLTAVGGFGLASGSSYDWWRLLLLLAGMTLVIGGSCVFNNYLDRDIDAKMARTRTRATVRGSIDSRMTLLYGIILTLLGTGLLLAGTNWLTTLLGLIGLVTYAGVYTLAKHRTPYATLIGTFPGAIPPVAGYAAVTGHLDLACLLLFLILVCWQMPHFYAIAIRRLDEYKAASVPVWPSVYGIRQTKQQMVWFMAAFIVVVIGLSLSGYASPFFAAILGPYGIYWLFVALRGYRTSDETVWAKKVFLLSLPVLPLFSILAFV